jgi:diguanylate cyclase (GGDEF)-like protein
MKESLTDAPPPVKVSPSGASAFALRVIPFLTSTRDRSLVWLRRHPLFGGMAVMALTAIGFSVAIELLNWVLPSSDRWAIYWPYNGITIALLLLSSRRKWPWIVAGFMLASVRSEINSHDPFGNAFIDVTCNLIEILIPAWTLPPFRSLKLWMMEPNLSLRFTFFAVLLGPAITSLPVAWHFHPVNHIGFWTLVIKWAFTDALGTALWAPLALILVSRETYDLFRIRELPQTLALLVALLTVTWFTFGQESYPLSFAPYPVLLFVAIRLGFSGAVIGANMLSLIAAYMSLRGHGPFALASHIGSDEQTLVLQIYSTLAMLFVLPLSVILIERRNFAAQLQQALGDMKQLATIDQLTSVANRRRFDESLDTEWKRAFRDGSPISLLMIDADHFKSFNDRYGHVAGDQCLRGIAAALHAKPLRQYDLVARYGGEEFAAILPGAPAAIAEQIAQQMRVSVLEACIRHEDNLHGRVTVSIGYATFVPARGTNPAELIAAADRALYRAKETGRNRVCAASALPLQESIQRPA